MKQGPHPDTHYLHDGHTSRSWMLTAACQSEDPDLWFPDHPAHWYGQIAYTTRTARNICDRCPVQGECLSYAIDTDSRYGMWGGLTENERQKLTGQRRYG